MLLGRAKLGRILLKNPNRTYYTFLVWAFIGVASTGSCVAGLRRSNPITGDLRRLPIPGSDCFDVPAMCPEPTLLAATAGAPPPPPTPSSFKMRMVKFSDG